VTALVAALQAPTRFYPLFALVVGTLLGLRWWARHGAGTERWDGAIRAFERLALTAMILAMLSLAMLQILLRNLFRTGLVWIDPLLRHLVLWIGVTGAVVATGRLRHIQMDVIGRLLPPGPRLLVTRLTSLVAAGICAVIARGAWVYLGEEADFGSAGLLGIPSWALTSVLFLGFALMSARFAVRAFDTRVRLAEILAQRESPIAGEGRPHA
jgi:TRAP-type C4-dicarboxylate transport system permease small subunit